MKKIYSLVILLLICRNLLAQDTLVMLPPQNLQGFSPDQTDYVKLNWEAPAFVPPAILHRSGLSVMDTTEVLTGYNIYRDSILIGTVGSDTLQYFDLEPVFVFPNEYHVSALYDLTAYGYPGETGESEWEGPVFVTLVSCQCDLPFREEFTTGLFTTNQWEPGEGNWVIAGQEGNPVPCAEFTYSPIVTDYSQSLTSYWLDGNVSNASDIFFDFDLKLTTNNNDSTENIYVDIFRSSEWINVAVYKNIQSTGWDHKRINITDEAIGDYFRVRFRAEGASTANIDSWQIDNINIFDKCPEPVGLTGEIGGYVESASIYPNPASSVITLSCGTAIEQVEIFNLLGNRLAKYILKANEHQIPVDVASFKNGVYLVKFTSHSSRTIVRKLIVQK